MSYNIDNVNKSSRFFDHLPFRMIRTLKNLLSIVQCFDGTDMLILQKKLTDIIYTSTLNDYSINLPVELQFLETPKSVKYAKKWQKVLSLYR